MEQVDLRKLFPDAEEGQCCLVEFDIASKSEDDGIIKISNSVDVYIDDVKVYARGTEQEAYVHIPVRVGKIKKNSICSEPPHLVGSEICAKSRN